MGDRRRRSRSRPMFRTPIDSRRARPQSELETGPGQKSRLGRLCRGRRLAGSETLMLVPSLGPPETGSLQDES
jgi:hypothetical protein